MERCDVFDRVGRSKDNVWVNVSYLIEFETCKEFVWGILSCLIE